MVSIVRGLTLAQLTGPEAPDLQPGSMGVPTDFPALVVLYDGVSGIVVGASATPSYISMEGDATSQALDGSVSPTATVFYTETKLNQIGTAAPLAGTWTAPADGSVFVHADGHFTVPSSPEILSVSLQRAGVSVRTITLDVKGGEQYVIAAAMTVSAGDTISVLISGIDVGDTALTHDFGALDIIYTPS